MEGYQKAIQRDFLYKVASKGVNQDFRVTSEYQEAILGDYRDRMGEFGMEVIRVTMEFAMAIFRDLMGMFVSK